MSAATLTLEPAQPCTQVEAFCRDFLADGATRFVLGRNRWAESIANLAPVQGFVDDFAAGQSFAGRVVIRTEEVPDSALVVSAAVGCQPVSAMRRLQERGLRCLDYFAFHRHFPKQTLPVWFLDECPAEFAQHRGEYGALYAALADAQSRTVLRNLLNFRLHADLGYLQGFRFAPNEQYFEDFLALQKIGEVFVDAGAYQGETTLEFLQRCPGYEAVHLFEPELNNLALAQKKLQPFARLHFHPCGLSDSNGTERFNIDATASAIDPNGSHQIKVMRLDDLALPRLTFLKMDIEGAEGAALAGAAQTLVRCRPRLAISVYHRLDDLRRIAQQVQQIFGGAVEIYLRHYTEGFTETVMFFVPRPL